MTTTYSVGYIVGSISSTSINRRLARALERLGAEAGLTLTEIPIVGLPFYSPDAEAPGAEYPAAAIAYRSAIESSDGVLMVTPEYNRSIPGVLKNALDWASRPNGKGPFVGRPSFVVGASVGAIGTAVGQQHLRSILSFLASPELAQPEVYLQMKAGLIEDDGTITADSTRDFLLAALKAFARHIERYAD